MWYLVYLTAQWVTFKASSALEENFSFLTHILWVSPSVLCVFMHMNVCRYVQMTAYVQTFYSCLTVCSGKVK